mgnify:CR=1 FL=1
MRVPVAGRRYYLRASLLAELAVILATYNEAENLTQLVEALEDLREDLQLVVELENHRPYRLSGFKNTERVRSDSPTDLRKEFAFHWVPRLSHSET